jgi:phosphomethylpyrimidine synthase
VCDCDQNISKKEDKLYWLELERTAQLVRKAIKKGVPIIVEGIGHAPLHSIPWLVKTAKSKCFGVPYRVLTVATDIALGFDHIASAIASSTAALHGADFITSVTRMEHIGEPNIKEIEEGVVAAKIAAHCADISKYRDVQKDFLMSKMRKIKGCRGVANLSIYPDATKKILEKNQIFEGSLGCTMCGAHYCAIEKCKLLENQEEVKK